MAAVTFNNEDEAAQYCLSFLRDGTPSEKIAARNRLALIFTRRGLYLEATELYEANVRAGVHAPELFEQLSESYRRIGDEGAAEAALAEARRLREAARPRPTAVAPPAGPHHEPQPAPQSQTQPPTTAQAQSRLTPASPSSDDWAGDAGTDRVLQSPAPATSNGLSAHLSQTQPALAGGHLQPAGAGTPLAATARMPAAHPVEPDTDAQATEQRSRRKRGLAVPGPILLPAMFLFLVLVPVVALALLIINPVALYLEGRPAGPTVDVAAPAPARLKVAPGTTASWYVQAGRSVSGLWATPGLELTLTQALDSTGSRFSVTAPRSQSWGETITIVERRGQGRSNQDTVLLATFAAPGTLPPAGTILDGRIAGDVTAPRLSESSQFNTTTEGIDVPVQLVVVSTPELWLDRFTNSLRMFFQEDRWLLVTIGALLTWCVLAGGTAILFRVRQA